MTEEEFVLSIIAMVMGSGVLIACIVKITDLIKTWISRGESHFSDEEFGRLAKAFMQHKKNMERRMQNLESIVTEETETGDAADTETEAIEYPELDEPKEESNLRNQLERKKKVR